MHISPTLLDKYQDWQESEISWENYYGKNEDPSVSLAEWDEKLEQQLIDACNGVETPSSRPADLGTCLNEAVDCILLDVPSTRDDVKLSSEIILTIVAEKGNNKFYFHKEDVVNLASYVEDCKAQEFVSTFIDTKYGTIQLYGYPDYYNDTIVTDLKTTSYYESGKFYDKWQRYIYPYILSKSGKIKNYKAFEFLVCKVSGETAQNPYVELTLYKETYTDPLASFETHIRTGLERFYEWFIDYHKKGIINNRLLGLRENS